MLIGFCGHRGCGPDGRNHGSGTLLPDCRWLSDEFGKPDQVVRRATEDEQPIHLLQSAQLDLPERTSLFQGTTQSRAHSSAGPAKRADGQLHQQSRKTEFDMSFLRHGQICQPMSLAKE
jgi:hypothetical protein